MGRRRQGWWAGGIVAALAAGAGCPPGGAAAPPRVPFGRHPAPGRVEFARDIRPILADKCFPCHGPDEGTRKAGLRLDVPPRPGRPLGGTRRGVLVPGRPEESRLVTRVEARDPARRMPPPQSKLALSPAEKSLLRRWVAQGGAYQRHWSLVPVPTRVPVPPVKNPAWCRSDLDRFVLARLEREGLRPSPPAVPADWLRRVTLDLTGLPPAPEEADAFLRDRAAPGAAPGAPWAAPGAAPGAFERVVDRLLASPRFGERMAVPWLDVARYADSYGYQSDLLSPTWPYRDWVVEAFNGDLPYDQFITQQLAGDLLPGATRSQRLATAFNRLHRMTNEGGSVPEEWRLEGVADRVNTLGTAFLGLTLECARCHDHKYDPISQGDYYAVSAFFNSIDEHGLYDRADIVPTPSLLLPTPEQERDYAAARESVSAAEAALGRARTAREQPFKTWMKAPSPPPAGPTGLADLTGYFDFESFDGVRLPNRVPGATRHGQRGDEVPLVEGRQGRAALLDGENNVNFPELGRFTRHTPYTLAFWMRDPRTAAEPAVIYQACSGTDTGPHGLDLLTEGGILTARMFRHWPGNAIAVRARREVPRGTWTHVAVTYDGSSRAAGLRIYLDGRPLETEVVRDRLYKGTGQHVLTFGQRFRDRGFKGGRLDDLHLFTRALTPLEVAHLHDGRAVAAAVAAGQAQETELREYYFSAVDPEVRKAASALTAARQRLVTAEDAQLEVAVMEELPQPRPAYVLARGRYDAPRTAATRVERDAPAAILPYPAGLRRDRLGLARWLTDPRHPLTARVSVNRVWALFFGRGLVETTENFGLQGTPPSHPELLDYLASTFSRRGFPAPGSPRTYGPWSVKGLVRAIVLSAAYRQSSAVRLELKTRDPQNVLLARGPSHRLSAEAIRDTALAASGLLDERRSGPPVSPFQPGDFWREANTMSPAYRQSVGGDLYRRSLYTVWKRTAPMPNMMAFDAVSREVCVARRMTTSTPLQALVLLNDPQFVEAARVLAERTLKEAGAEPGEHVRCVFRRLAGREPAPGEQRLLLTLYLGQREQFAREPEAAARLVRIGDRKPDAALPPAEVAAATVLAQAVLNMDATVWKR